MSLEHTGNVKGNEEVYLIRYHKRMPTIPLHNASIFGQNLVLHTFTSCAEVPPRKEKKKEKHTHKPIITTTGIFLCLHHVTKMEKFHIYFFF